MQIRCIFKDLLKYNFFHGSCWWWVTKILITVLETLNQCLNGAPKIKIWFCKLSWIFFKNLPKNTLKLYMIFSQSQERQEFIDFLQWNCYSCLQTNNFNIIWGKIKTCLHTVGKKSQIWSISLKITKNCKVAWIEWIKRTGKHWFCC